MTDLEQGKSIPERSREQVREPDKTLSIEDALALIDNEAEAIINEAKKYEKDPNISREAKKEMHELAAGLKDAADSYETSIRAESSFFRKEVVKGALERIGSVATKIRELGMPVKPIESEYLKVGEFMEAFSGVPTQGVIKAMPKDQAAAIIQQRKEVAKRQVRDLKDIPSRIDWKSSTGDKGRTGDEGRPGDGEARL